MANVRNHCSRKYKCIFVFHLFLRTFGVAGAVDVAQCFNILLKDRWDRQKVIYDKLLNKLNRSKTVSSIDHYL